MHKLAAITFDTYSRFAVVQSDLHISWAWKYSSTLGGSTINYSPADCFQTFPFPPVETGLNKIGECYYEHRRQMMLKMWLGLTKTYNLFHDPELSVELVAKESKQPLPVAESARADLLQLRALHKQMDEAVLAAYGWTDLDLAHDFYEVDYLPENDRIRYTIHPDARKEILKRLLELNHKIYAGEVARGLHNKKAQGKVKIESDHKLQPELDMS